MEVKDDECSGTVSAEADYRTAKENLRHKEQLSLFAHR